MSYRQILPAALPAVRTARPRSDSGFHRLRGLAALLLAAVVPGGTALAQSSANYGYTTATNASLTDMSSGTIQLVAPGSDDVASAVNNIGFDFYFLGTRYTQFTASSNGFLRLGGTAVSGATYALGAAATPLITSLGSDLVVSPTGRVHYKVEGTAPNRVLTVEFLNMHIIYSTTPTADGTSQIRLHENSGRIELV